MSNPTPGPWSNDHSVEISAGHKSICGMRFPFDGEENQANAHLIAAAPELLEALESATKLIISLGGNKDWDHIVYYKSVIAKAKGEK